MRLYVQVGPPCVSFFSKYGGAISECVRRGDKRMESLAGCGKNCHLLLSVFPESLQLNCLLHIHLSV